MNKIVGLCGFAGSGKDTVGKIFQEYGYEKYSMAKPLKDIISILFSWDRDMIDGITDESRIWREQPDIWWTNKLNWREKYGCDFTPRICLQSFGTDLIRNQFHNDMWLNVMERYLMDTTSDIIITDSRFYNELNKIKELNGYIIRVKRKEDPLWVNDVLSGVDKKIISKEYNIHESEIDWVDFNSDFIIDNSKDLPYTKSQIIKIIDKINHY